MPLGCRDRDDRARDPSPRHRAGARDRLSIDDRSGDARPFQDLFASGVQRRPLDRRHPPERDLGTLSRGVSLQGGRQPGEARPVDPHGAGHRVDPHPLDQFGRTDDHPGLGATKELVTREEHQIGAPLERLAGAWLTGEPGARQTLERGADLVLFSGDKLLGGPQAGVIVGSAELIERVRVHPVARAVRIDGPSLAGLAATLERYAAGKGAEIPFWRMAAIERSALHARCEEVLEGSGVAGAIVDGEAVPGAGSVPGRGIPGPVIAVAATERQWRRLLEAEPPVVARRDEGRLVLDLRAVEEADDQTLAAALAFACR